MAARGGFWRGVGARDEDWVAAEDPGMVGGARRGQPAAKSVRREPLAARSWGECQRDGRHEGAKSGDRAKMSFFQETADSSRGSTERLPRRAGKALVGAGEAGRRGDHVWLRQELRER